MPIRHFNRPGYCRFTNTLPGFSAFHSGPDSGLSTLTFVEGPATPGGPGPPSLQNKRGERKEEKREKEGKKRGKKEKKKGKKKRENWQEGRYDVC